MEKEVINTKDILKKQRARFRLDTLAGFRDVPNVVIGKIPTKRTLFPHTKNDYWQQIQTDENKTSCLYTLGANNVFTTHKHVFFDETVEVLTKGAKVEWVTEKGIFYYSYGDKFTVEKGIEHALVNLVNFPIDLKVDWKPKMIYGWEGNFKQIKTLKKQ